MNWGKPIDSDLLQDFESHIPHGMRYKEYSVIDPFKLYWVTQDPFTVEDLIEFGENLYRIEPQAVAYVTLRDISKGQSQDLANDNVVTVSADGILSLGNYADNFKEAFPDEYEECFGDYVDDFEEFKNMLEGNLHMSLNALLGHFADEYPNLTNAQIKEGFEEALESFMERYFE